MEIERTILVCVIVVLMLVVYFGTIRPAREEAACMAYVRREWYGKLRHPGPTFREGDRVRATGWIDDDEDGRGTVVGVATERAPDGAELTAYWVAFDTLSRDFGPNKARPLKMAPCELEPEEKVA